MSTSSPKVPVDYSRWVNRRKAYNAVVPYLFITPFIVSYLIFFLFPNVYSLILSFYEYKGFGVARFVGIDNYSTILTYPRFWKVVATTFFYLFWHVVPVTVIAFLLALAVNSRVVSNRMRGIYKPIMFLPQIVATVASALVFRVLFSTRSGVINHVLGTHIPFLDDYWLTRWVVVALFTWRSVGWYLVIFLAGLTTISPETDEAAIIDGANSFQRMRHITIPLMRPIFLFVFLVNSVGSLKIYTEPAVILGVDVQASPSQVAPIMSMLKSYLGQGKFGLASAVGWILFLLIFVVSLVQMGVFRGRAKHA